MAVIVSARNSVGLLSPHPFTKVFLGPAFKDVEHCSSTLSFTLTNYAERNWEAKRDMKKLKSFSVLIATFLSICTLTSCDEFDEIFNDIYPELWPWHQEGGDDEMNYKGEVLKFGNAEGSLTIEFGVEIGVEECTEDINYENWYTAYVHGDVQWLVDKRGVRITYKNKEIKSRILQYGHNWYAGIYWMRCNDGPYWDSASGKYLSNKYSLANGMDINLIKCTGKTSMRISIEGQELYIKDAKVTQKK